MSKQDSDVGGNGTDDSSFYKAIKSLIEYRQSDDQGTVEVSFSLSIQLR